MTLRCPSADELERLLQAQFVGANETALDAHLSACAECRRVLDRLTSPVRSDASTVSGDLPAEHEADWRAHQAGLHASFLGQLRRCSAAETRPSSLPLVPGYRIEGPLGEGGAGIVYRAQHIKLQRPVAVKLLRPGSLDRAAGRARFQREAEVLSRLRHPHIVQLFDFGEIGPSDGPATPFMVLELVEGGTLSEKVNRRPLPARAAAALIETLALALRLVHEQGIIHRDLKPGNILLQPTNSAAGPDLADPGRLLEEYVPKITDFGLAKQLTAEQTQWTQTHDLLGTPAYMAPEQAGEGKELTPAADVYALGVILYELLTGLPPFRARDWVELIVQVKEQEPLSPSRFLLGIPRDLETICLKCLDKAPARRYASAQELADDCRRFLDGRTILARPTGRGEKLWRWGRRNPGVAGLSLFVFLLLVLGLIVTTSLFLAAEARRGEAQEAVDQLKQEQKRLTQEQGRTKQALAAEKRRREQARQALEAITSEMVPEWLGRSSELTAQQRQFLMRALTLYQEFARDTATDEASRVGVAAAQLRVAQFQRSLAQLDEAQRSAEQAQQSWEWLVAEFPANRDYGRSLALAYWLQAVLLRDLGKKTEAEPYVRRALALNQRLLATDGSDPRAALQQCDCLNTLATLLRQTGRLKEAEEQWRALLPLRRQFATRFPRSAEHGIGLLWVHLNLALVLQQTTRPEEADQEIQSALAVAVPLAAEHVSSPDCPQWLARCREVHGDILTNLGEPTKAELEYRAAVTLLTALYRDYPGRPGIRNELAGVMGSLARVLIHQNQREEGRRWLEEAEPHHQAALAAEPRNAGYRRFFRNNRWALADCLVDLGDHAAAARTVDQWLSYAVEARLDAYQAASCLARCVPLVQKDEKLTEAQHQELAEKYGARAVKLLLQAYADGFRDVQALNKNPALRALRERPDYQKFLADLEGSGRVPCSPRESE